MQGEPVAEASKGRRAELFVGDTTNRRDCRQKRRVGFDHEEGQPRPFVPRCPEKAQKLGGLEIIRSGEPL